VIRFFDILLSLFGLLFASPLLLLLFIVGLLDSSSPLFFQVRVGRNKKPFILVKFRTMKVGTEDIASHLASLSSITPFGHFLRKYKLDELPQLWNVLKGEMSLVGPRPNLFNQDELIREREALNIYSTRPGITGIAQIKHIDMSNPKLLAQTDAEMLQSLNLSMYFKLILKTALGAGWGDKVRH